ncbi:MAG TPA: response regulator, partial [Rhizobiales bacterium]|nr:response regulator [Hyphomicrobiales bacterium]
MLKRAITSDIELKIRPGENIWAVKADKTQLETAILNLSINARDAMKDGGTLIVETENKTLDATYTKQHEDLTPGDYVVISVSDTGHGMPADIIDKVLQPFFTTKAPGSGSGLGLSMIYGFVKQSKGHLSIYSEENTGTTIRIYLPRCIEETEDLPAADELPTEQELQQDNDNPVEEEGTAPQVKKPIVLIAEDNNPVRDVAVAMIEEMDYIVLDAPDGEKALEIIKQRDDIDLLLSDVVMPGMNGPELAAAALEIRPDLKVLFASGYTQGTAEEMHELPNFIELIDKPFTQDELTSKVRAAVENQMQKETDAA